MIKTIIFDNNGVLVTSNEETGFRAISKATGISEDKFRPVYDELARNVDEGSITTRDFFKEITDRFNLKFKPKDLEDVIYGSFVRKEDTISFIKELREKYNVALLTNFGDAFRRLDKRWRVTDLFDKDKVFLSCEMKMRKPNMDIYIEVLRRLNQKPSEIIFVDDKIENVEVAKKIGIKGIVFKTSDQLKQELQKYITI